MWKLGLLCCRICWRPFSSKQTMGTRHAINSCWTYTGVHPWPFGLQDETALHADPFRLSILYSGCGCCRLAAGMCYFTTWDGQSGAR